MTLACHKAAKRVEMEYQESVRGVGWWGSNDYKDYYENLGGGDDPFSYVKVIPLISKEAQHKNGGFDHAGLYETALMYSLYPNQVDLTKCKANTEWFTDSISKKATDPLYVKKLGDFMVQNTIDALLEEIK